MQFLPSETLKPYVKGYFVINVGADLNDEVFYPSGYIDFAINISSGNAITIINGRSVDMPNVEVLGHLTTPTRLTVTKGTAILIARIYPHASGLFFPNSINNFTNHSIDLSDVIGDASNDLYDQVMLANGMEQKVSALDHFLAHELKKNEKMHKKAKLVERICADINQKKEKFDLQDLSNRYGVSERYIQKLFVSVVGLTPSSFFSVHRFNKSLQLIQSSASDLTTIAYDCGYYDQAHFIKEFKKYTGITPSEARGTLSISASSTI